jgi:hypothetical protein
MWVPEKIGGELQSCRCSSAMVRSAQNFKEKR